MKPVKDEQKNGTTKQDMPHVKAPLQAPLPPAPAKQAETVKPTIEERIQKVEELRSLTAKRHRTINTLHQLRAFHFASDDTCVLTIMDSQRQKFETGNSNLIALLKSYLEAVLADKVSALDDDILDFKI